MARGDAPFQLHQRRVTIRFCLKVGVFVMLGAATAAS
jgi:hypothetical protein